jgi:hypothetical protein
MDARVGETERGYNLWGLEHYGSLQEGEEEGGE